MADVYCSFCSKSQHEVGKLIAGPCAFICNECVDLCHDIVHEKPLPQTPMALQPAIAWHELSTHVDKLGRVLSDLRWALLDAQYPRSGKLSAAPPGKMVDFAKPPDHDDELRLRDIHIGFGKPDDEDK